MSLSAVVQKLKRQREQDWQGPSIVKWRKVSYETILNDTVAAVRVWVQQGASGEHWLQGDGDNNWVLGDQVLQPYCSSEPYHMSLNLMHFVCVKFSTDVQQSKQQACIERRSSSLADDHVTVTVTQIIGHAIFPHDLKPLVQTMYKFGASEDDSAIIANTGKTSCEIIHNDTNERVEVWAQKLGSQRHLLPGKLERWQADDYILEPGSSTEPYHMSLNLVHVLCARYKYGVLQRQRTSCIGQRAPPMDGDCVTVKVTQIIENAGQDENMSQATPVAGLASQGNVYRHMHTTLAPSEVAHCGAETKQSRPVVVDAISYEKIHNDMFKHVEVWVKHFGPGEHWPTGDQVLPPNRSTKNFQMPLDLLHAVCVRYGDGIIQQRKTVCKERRSSPDVGGSVTVEVSQIVGDTFIPKVLKAQAKCPMEPHVENKSKQSGSNRPDKIIHESIHNDALEPVEVWVKRVGDTARRILEHIFLEPNCSTEVLHVPLDLLHEVCVRHKGGTLEERRLVCTEMRTPSIADTHVSVNVSQIIGSVVASDDPITPASSVPEPQDHLVEEVNISLAESFAYYAISNDVNEPVEVWLKLFGYADHWPPGHYILQPDSSTEAYRVQFDLLHGVCARYRYNSLQGSRTVCMGVRAPSQLGHLVTIKVSEITADDIPRHDRRSRLAFSSLGPSSQCCQNTRSAFSIVCFMIFALFVVPKARTLQRHVLMMCEPLMHR